MSKLHFILDDELPGGVQIEANENGIIKNKTISINDFVRSITSSIDRVLSLDYVLPKNCIRFFCKGDIIGIVFTVDKCIAPAIHKTFEGNNTFILPYPNLLFITYYNLISCKLTSSKVYALKESSRDNPELFYFPYGNVYDDGKICYGDNEILLKKQRLDLATKEFVDVFLSSPYNGDLYQLNNTAYFCSLADLFKELNNKQKFPEEMLTSTKQNLSDVIL